MIPSLPQSFVYFLRVFPEITTTLEIWVVAFGAYNSSLQRSRWAKASNAAGSRTSGVSQSAARLRNFRFAITTAVATDRYKRLAFNRSSGIFLNH
jgi:hypothetical protein